MKIEIVENLKEKMKMDNKYIKEVINGKININKKKAEKTIVVTPESFAKMFSPERMKLMLRIMHNETISIYSLAKNMNRKYEAVYRDLKLLEGFGIIKLKRKENRTIPFIDETIKMPELAAS